MNLAALLTHPALPGHDQHYGLVAPRRRAVCRLATVPLGLPVERFLLRPPFPPPLAPSPLVSAAPVPAALPSDPIAHATMRRIVQAILEVLDDRRALAQLAPVVDPSVQGYVAALVEHLHRAPRRATPRLLSMRVCQPHEDAAEISAVCRLAGRPRAMAARFEREAGCAGSFWRCRLVRLW